VVTPVHEVHSSVGAEPWPAVRPAVVLVNDFTS
jgi:hypothetical protein